MSQTEGAADKVDVIAVGPHPDDLEIICGGTLAKLVKQGYRVAMIDLTTGEPTPRGSVDIRVREAEAARQKLGVQMRLNLGLPNRELMDCPASRYVLATAFRRLRPNVVIGVAGRTPAASPDHNQAHLLIEAARFYSQLTKWDDRFAGTAPFRVPHLVYAPFPIDAEQRHWHGAFVVDISDTMEQKMAAVQCYHSQFDDNRFERVRHFVTGQNIATGSRCGFSYGEFFALPTPVGTGDLHALVMGAKGSPAPVTLPGHCPGLRAGRSDEMKRTIKNHVPKDWRLSDFLKSLGDISPKRIRMDPWPGRAVASDVVAIQEHEDRLCELIDGVLVEKIMGFQEGYLGALIIAGLQAFVKALRLRAWRVVGDGGMVQLEPGLVRIADTAYFSWERLGGRKVPSTPVPSIYPDLAVEVLSAGNTKGEMQRKRKDFFFHGVRLVWQVDPRKRCVDVYSSPDDFVRYSEAGTPSMAMTRCFPGFHAILASCLPVARRLNPSHRRSPRRENVASNPSTGVALMEKLSIGPKLAKRKRPGNKRRCKGWVRTRATQR